MTNKEMFKEKYDKLKSVYGKMLVIKYDKTPDYIICYIYNGKILISKEQAKTKNEAREKAVSNALKLKKSGMPIRSNNKENNNNKLNSFINIIRLYYKNVSYHSSSYNDESYYFYKIDNVEFYGRAKKLADAKKAIDDVLTTLLSNKRNKLLNNKTKIYIKYKNRYFEVMASTINEAIELAKGKMSYKSEKTTLLKAKQENIIKSTKTEKQKTINPKTSELIKKYENEFKENYYTIFCEELNKIYNIQITKSYMEIKYHGGSDRNGYAQGQLVEELNADIEISKKVFSDISPVGQELINSYVGYSFKTDVENKITHYIVLNVTNYIKERNC